MINKIIIIVFLLVAFSAQAQDQNEDLWSLQKCVDYAMNNNLDIQRSKLNVDRNQVNHLESKLNRLPDLNTGGQYSARWGRSIDPTSNLFVTRRIISNGISANSSLPIFNGLQINNTIRQNEALVEASQYQQDVIENNVTLDIVSFYMDVIFNDALVDNAETQLETSQAQLEQTKKLVDAGALPLSDMLELESQVASNEVELIQAQNTLNLSVLSLKQLLQIPSEQSFQTETPEIEVDNYDIDIYSIEEVYAAALINMPDVKRAQKSQESAEIGVDVARGGYYPSLSISGNIFTNYSDAAQGPVNTDIDPNVITRDIGYLEGNPAQRVVTNVEIPAFDDNYTIPEQYADNLSKSLSLNLNIPIFNNFRTRSNVQRAIISKEEAAIDVEDTRNQMRQSIERAYYDAQAAAETYTASVKQVESLEESFRSIQKRYNLGAVDFVDYQVANNNLFRARTELLRSKYSYVFRIKVLDFYMGNKISFE